jgi:hypothetical protein
MGYPFKIVKVRMNDASSNAENLCDDAVRLQLGRLLQQ